MVTKKQENPVEAEPVEIIERWTLSKTGQYIRHNKLVVRCHKRSGGHEIEVEWNNNKMRTQFTFPDPVSAKRYGRKLFNLLKGEKENG